MNTINLKLLTAASVLIVAPAFAGDQAHKMDNATDMKGTADQLTTQQPDMNKKPMSAEVSQATSGNSRSFDSVDMDRNSELDANELKGVQSALNELEGKSGVNANGDDILSNYDQDSTGTLNQEEYQAMLDDRTGIPVSGVNIDAGEPRSDSGQQPPADADRVLAGGTVGSSDPNSGPQYNIQTAEEGSESLVTLDNSDAKRLESKPSSTDEATEGTKKINANNDRSARELAKEQPSEINPVVASPADISVSQNVYTAPLDRIEGKDVKSEEGKDLGSVETILVKNDGTDAALLIVNDQGEELFTPVKDVRMQDDTLVLVSTSRPVKDYDKSLYSEIDKSQKNITSAIAILSISAL